MNLKNTRTKLKDTGIVIGQSSFFGILAQGLSNLATVLIASFNHLRRWSDGKKADSKLAGLQQIEAGASEKFKAEGQPMVRESPPVLERPIMSGLRRDLTQQLRRSGVIVPQSEERSFLALCGLLIRDCEVMYSEEAGDA